MTKKWHETICKCAEIRKNDDDGCPFGLRIPFGCKRAGDAVDRMAPVTILGEEASDEERQTLAKANKRMLNWTILGKTTEEPGQCKYAAKVFPDKAAVECNYEDTAPGVGQQSVTMAAPFYSQVFSGVGLNGLYSYPIGYYADYNISRNLFYGLYSLQGGEDLEMLCKIAALARNEKVAQETIADRRVRGAISHLLKLHFGEHYSGNVSISSLYHNAVSPLLMTSQITIPAAEYYANTEAWNAEVARFLESEVRNMLKTNYSFKFTIRPDKVREPVSPPKLPKTRPVVRPPSIELVNLARQLPPELLEKFEAWYGAAARNQGSDRIESSLLSMAPDRFISMFTNLLRDVPLAEVYERFGGE